MCFPTLFFKYFSQLRFWKDKRATNHNKTSLSSFLGGGIAVGIWWESGGRRIEGLRSIPKDSCLNGISVWGRPGGPAVLTWSLALGEMSLGAHLFLWSRALEDVGTGVERVRVRVCTRTGRAPARRALHTRGSPTLFPLVPSFA